MSTETTYCNGRTADAPDDLPKMDPGPEHAGEGYCKKRTSGGRCRFHGRDAGRPAKHGRYAAERSESLQKKIETYREDGTPADMWEELALLRAVLQEWLADMETVTEDNVGVLLNLQDSIRRTLDTINKIQTRTALTAAEVDFLQARIADLFRRYVPEDDRADALDDLKQVTAPNGPRRN